MKPVTGLAEYKNVSLWNLLWCFFTVSLHFSLQFFSMSQADYELTLVFLFIGFMVVIYLLFTSEKDRKTQPPPTVNNNDSCFMTANRKKYLMRATTKKIIHKIEVKDIFKNTSPIPEDPKTTLSLVLELTTKTTCKQVELPLNSLQQLEQTLTERSKLANLIPPKLPVMNNLILYFPSITMLLLNRYFGKMIRFAVENSYSDLISDQLLPLCITPPSS